MTIDAVALLAIPGLAPPADAIPGTVPIRHAGDASLVFLHTRYAPERAAEHAFALRMLFGDTLDRHADPRGILLFPDIIAPRGEGYGAIVAEVGDGGAWAPVPGAGDLAPALAAAPEGSAGALEREMIAALGRDRAEALVVALEVALINRLARPGAPRTDAAAETAIAAAMGADFAARLAAAVAARIAAEIGDGSAPPPLDLG